MIEESITDTILYQILEGVDHPFLQSEDIYSSWLKQVAQEENTTINVLIYIFCSDEYLLDINIKYLGHDYYTDIITFPYKEKEDLESDLFVSLERVKENAIEYNESFDAELQRVMVHGLLHLIGYGDKTESEANAMRVKEDYYIAKFPKSIK